jgi:pimeloyl-ACP methyl ester carboxylesterase
MAIPALVLVHGGGFAADSWELTVAEVRRLAPELNVVPLDMPGRRHVPGDLREMLVADYVDSLVGDIENAGLEDLVIVGHSLGGMMLPGVVTKLGAARVREMIFAAALLPAEGTSIVDSSPWLVAKFARRRANKGVPSPVPKWMSRFVYMNGVPRAERRFMAGKEYAESLRILTEKVSRRGIGRCGHHVAAGQHHRGGLQRVTGQARVPGIGAHPAAERKTRDADGGATAGGHRPPPGGQRLLQRIHIGRRGDRHVAGSAVEVGSAGKPAQVQDHCAGSTGRADVRMSAAPRCDLHVVGRRERHRLLHVRLRRNSHHRSGIQRSQNESKTPLAVVNWAPLAGSSTLPPMEAARPVQPPPGSAPAGMGPNAAPPASTDTAPRRKL